MRITITIDTDNDAFVEAGAGYEVARILRKAATSVEAWPGANTFTLTMRDINGNKVGKLEATDA